MNFADEDLGNGEYESEFPSASRDWMATAEIAIPYIVGAFVVAALILLAGYVVAIN